MNIKIPTTNRQLKSINSDNLYPTEVCKISYKQTLIFPTLIKVISILGIKSLFNSYSLRAEKKGLKKVVC